MLRSGLDLGDWVESKLTLFVIFLERFQVWSGDDYWSADLLGLTDDSRLTGEEYFGQVLIVSSDPRWMR
jgi:hypothetical protein